MEINEISEFVDGEILRLREMYSSKSDEELTLAMTIKMGEEMGELFNQVLAHKGFQRKDKLNTIDKEEIEHEIADVLITTDILSKRFNINIEEALKKKIAKIKGRSY